MWDSAVEPYLPSSELTALGAGTFSRTPSPQHGLLAMGPREMG
jgi:hypothetical protein